MWSWKVSGRRRVAALALGVGLSVSAVWVGAAEEAAAQEGMESVLQGLRWGAKKEEVLRYYKDQKQEEFRAAAKEVRDPIQKEKLRRQKLLDEYKEIEDSWTPLKGPGRTGYEVSVVSGEFQKDSGEALLRVKDERAQKFYFFVNERLWKMAIVYNADYLSGIGFEAFVEQVVRKYGDSDESEYDSDGYLARAMWRDPKSELRIEDKSSFFGTFVMVFSDLETLQQRRDAGAVYGGGGEERDRSADLASIKEDDGFAADSNIVDRLVGQNIEVNLDRGRPESVEIKKVGSRPTGEEESGDEKKKKKKVAPKGRPKKGGNGKKADDLIIY